MLATQISYNSVILQGNEGIIFYGQLTFSSKEYDPWKGQGQNDEQFQFISAVPMPGLSQRELSNVSVNQCQL